MIEINDIYPDRIDDSDPQESFDSLVRLAADLASAPIASISFMDRDQQWLKSEVGISGTPSLYLDFSNKFLNYQHFSPNSTGKKVKPLICRDIRNEPRFANHPLLIANPSLRFYAAFPIITPKQLNIGLLSIMDYVPRDLTPDCIKSLGLICQQIYLSIEMQRRLINWQNKFNKLQSIINQRQEVWELVRQERDFITVINDTVEALVVVLNQKAEIVRFNRTCQNLTGYTAKQVEQKSFWELFCPEDEHQKIEAQFQEILATGGDPQGNQFESTLITEDGNYRSIAWSSRVIFDEHGVVKYVVSTGIDITERHQNELKIQQTQHFLNSIVENIPDMIFVKDAKDLTFIQINKAGEKLIGHRREELIGKNDYDLFTNEEAEFFTKKDKEVLGKGQLLDITEEKIYTKNLGLRTLHTKKIPIFDETGKPKYLLGIAEDITQRKESEATLYLLQRAIEASSNGIVITDASKPGNPIIYCNQAFEKITGYSLEETLGKNCRFLQGNDTSQEAVSEIRQGLQEQKEVRVIVKNYRRDGTHFWNDLTISPVRDSDGKLTNFVGVQSDITQQKEATDALKQSEERYRLLAENATDLISRHNPEGVYLYASPASLNLLGYSPEELIGKSVYDFWHPEDLELLTKQNHKPIFICEHINPKSYRARRQDGSYIWLETTYHTICDPSQTEILELVAVSRDITERKQVEASLLERSRLSTLEAQVGKALSMGGSLETILKKCTAAMVAELPSIGAAIWTWNQQTHNLELQALSGISTEVLDKYFPANLSEIDSPTSSPEITYNLVVAEREIGMMRILTDNPIADTVSEVLTWVANAISVGIDRYWAREELLSRRESLLFRLASQIRNSLDIDQILQTAVSEIRSLLQVDRCHFLWYLKDILPTPELAITHEAINPNVVNGHTQYTTEQNLYLSQKILDRQPVRLDDLTIPNLELDENLCKSYQDLGIKSQLLLPLQTHAGQLGAVVCLHYQNPRPWLNQEVELLQAVVDQLAIAIYQAELYAQTRATALAAQTQAQQLSEAIVNIQQKEAQLIQNEKMSSLGQMVAGVAHEINNPVNFIYGNLTYCQDYIRNIIDLIELYQKNYPNPPAEIKSKQKEIELEFIVEDLPKILTSMEIGTERIRKIVLSLRNFSRLDEADMKAVDIHEGIENTLLILLNRLKPKAHESAINIIKEYSQLPKIECYPGQLNQVFMNIISNAIDALEKVKDNPTITIKTELVPPGPETMVPQEIIIKIKDNGEGMDLNTKNKLFDPFFTTKPVGKGTGLGLSISYKIVVDKHRGTLDCISEPGKGAEFMIQIPIYQSKVQ